VEHFTLSLEETPTELTDIFQSIQNMEQTSLSSYGSVGIYQELENMRMVKIGEYNPDRELVETEIVMIYYPEEKSFSGGLNYGRLDPERYGGKTLDIPEKLYSESMQLIDRMR
jgi:hypothetical protein